MSRQSAIARITTYYTAFNAGDGEGMLACLSENIAHDINQGARQSGKAAFREFLAHMDRCYREQLADIVIMANEDGTRGAAEFVVHGEYLTTDEGLPEANGQRYVLSAGAFFDLQDDLITRVSVYYNLADWMAQVSA
jgi:steroid delta-isomerase-like uncharacterized protein